MPIDRNTKFGAPPQGGVGPVTFDATLYFDSYANISLYGNSLKKVFYYVDRETNLYYRLANTEVINLLQRNQLSPVITATWVWVSQGGKAVLKTGQVRYAGLTSPSEEDGGS